jgi:hypothetical protein
VGDSRIAAQHEDGIKARFIGELAGVDSLNVGLPMVVRG